VAGPDGNFETLPIIQGSLGTQGYIKNTLRPRSGTSVKPVASHVEPGYRVLRVNARTSSLQHRQEKSRLVGPSITSEVGPSTIVLDRAQACLDDQDTRSRVAGYNRTRRPRTIILALLAGLGYGCNPTWHVHDGLPKGESKGVIRSVDFCPVGRRADSSRGAPRARGKRAGSGGQWTGGVHPRGAYRANSDSPIVSCPACNRVNLLARAECPACGPDRAVRDTWG
jgi:hypothetical protein